MVSKTSPTKESPLNMSSETFEKMLQTSEKLIDNGAYDNIAFRLSGGEPLLVYDTYKDLVSKYYKCNRNFSFGLLSNLTILTDEILKWLQKNNIGVQVSLDDLENSKPLANGQSSSKITMKNIKRFQEEGINFSINTVLDVKKTKSLKDMVEYVCSLRNIQWGLNTSYTMDDDSLIDEVVQVFKEAISLLGKKGFNILHALRFCNMIIGKNEGGCISGIGTCALGTNLEVWPCQAFNNKKPLGYYGENIKELLATSKENEYFRNRTLMPRCTDCSILQYCRGGCRVANLTNKKAIEVTCEIKQKVLEFILNQKRNSNKNCNRNNHGNNCERNCESDNDGLNNCGYNECDHGQEFDNRFEEIVSEYIEKQTALGKELKYVETPLLDG
jgi:uncharacterized protein